MRQFWTDWEFAWLLALYPDLKTELIAEALGRKLASVYNKAFQLGLEKSAEFLASPASGRTNGLQGAGTRFAKGLTPWNKGIAFDSGGRSVETRFKAGQMPHNTHAVGSYRITKDGTLQRKVGTAKGSNSVRWRGVHELAWIEANGPVPHGHIVVFKPGQRTQKLEEITADRVECISFAENMKRNTRHNLPKPLNDLIALRAALTRQINKRTKHEQ